MKSVMTKAYRPLTKERKIAIPGGYSTKGDIFTKEARTVKEVAATVKESAPTTKAEILQHIEEAQQAQKDAGKAKEDAETEDEFNKACDAESHARDKEAFYKKQLDRFEYTPRMNEEEYYNHVEALRSKVEEAAARFREVSEKAISEIISAKEAYLDVAYEADDALIALDEAANVLQSKYRYRPVTYVDASPKMVEDPVFWKRYALRYKNCGTAYKLITEPDNKWNESGFLAWRVAELFEQRTK